MFHQVEGFWRRTLSKNAKRVTLLLCFIAVVLGEGWLGRRRLFISPNRQYLITFVAFVACLAGLMSALTAIAATDSLIDRQVRTGVLACLAISLIGVFGDYTAENVSVVGVIGSVFTGVILGAWNATTTKTQSDIDER